MTSVLCFILRESWKAPAAVATTHFTLLIKVTTTVIIITLLSIHHTSTSSSRSNVFCRYIGSRGNCSSRSELQQHRIASDREHRVGLTTSSPATRLLRHQTAIGAFIYRMDTYNSQIKQSYSILRSSYSSNIQ